MYNSAISPLAASAGVDNAELLTDPLAKHLFFGLLLENYAVLRHADLTAGEDRAVSSGYRSKDFTDSGYCPKPDGPILPPFIAMAPIVPWRPISCRRPRSRPTMAILVRLAGTSHVPLNRAAVNTDQPHHAGTASTATQVIWMILLRILPTKESRHESRHRWGRFYQLPSRHSATGRPSWRSRFFGASYGVRARL